MAYNLLSTQVPTPCPLFVNTLGNGNGGNFYSGQTIGVSQNLNQLQSSVEFPRGAYGIISGLNFTFSASSFQVQINPGVAYTGAIQEFVSTNAQVLQKLAPIVTVNPNSTGYIFLNSTGVYFTTTFPTYTQPTVYLGSLVSNSSGVVSADYSGVIYLTHNSAYRHTADLQMPLDTADISNRFDTYTQFGTYSWNGMSHILHNTALNQNPLSSSVIASSGTLTNYASNVLVFAPTGNISITLPTTGIITNGHFYKLLNQSSYTVTLTAASSATISLGSNTGTDIYFYNGSWISTGTYSLSILPAASTIQIAQRVFSTNTPTPSAY